MMTTLLQALRSRTVLFALLLASLYQIATGTSVLNVKQ